MSWLLVLAGAVVGAPLRYLTDRAIQRRHDTVYPWGTFAVNVVGCFVLGVLVEAAAREAWVWPLLGVGFCGALTTYSTFSYETLRLAETGSRFYAVGNVVASVLAGLGVAYAGTAAGRALWA